MTFESNSRVGVIVEASESYVACTDFFRTIWFIRRTNDATGNLNTRRDRMGQFRVVLYGKQ